MRVISTFCIDLGRPRYSHGSLSEVTLLFRAPRLHISFPCVLLIALIMVHFTI